MNIATKFELYFVLVGHLGVRVANKSKANKPRSNCL